MDRSSPSLPSKLVRNSQHVIHTVGPIANGNPTNPHRAQLASCLHLSHDKGLRSIAFCCISTGVFGFPQEEAARIAVQPVRRWLLDSSSPITVVFNVFSSVDYEIYADLLGI